MCFRPLVRACMRMKLRGTVVGHPVCAFLTVTLDKILKKQAEIFKTADERIKLAQQKQKEQYKKRKGIVEYNFKIGNKVLRRNMLQKTRKGNKGEDRWLGPYVIELTTTSDILAWEDPEEKSKPEPIEALHPARRHGG